MVQIFVEKEFTPTFENGNLPQLLYVCKAEADYIKLPGVMHMHEDHLEILFIKSGRGIHTIGGQQYNTKQGDILIYNSGVIHDKPTNPDTKMSVYSCCVGNLKLKGMRENCLLPEGLSPVLRSSVFSKDIEDLFYMMYTQAYSGNTKAEEICHHLLLSLLIILIKQFPK